MPLLHTVALGPHTRGRNIPTSHPVQGGPAVPGAAARRKPLVMTTYSVDRAGGRSLGVTPALASAQRPTGSGTQSTEIAIQRLSRADSIRAVLRVYQEVRAGAAAAFLNPAVLEALARNLPSEPGQQLKPADVEELRVGGWVGASHGPAGRRPKQKLSAAGRACYGKYAPQ